jgi:hypothetical protein
MIMAAKLVGAGLATIALAGAAIGVGLIFAAPICRRWQHTAHGARPHDCWRDELPVHRSLDCDG